MASLEAALLGAVSQPYTPVVDACTLDVTLRVSALVRFWKPAWMLDVIAAPVPGAHLQGGMLMLFAGSACFLSCRRSRGHEGRMPRIWPRPTPAPRAAVG